MLHCVHIRGEGGVVVVILGFSGNSRFWLALVGHRTFSFLFRDKVNTALALFGGPGLNLLKGLQEKT